MDDEAEIDLVATCALCHTAHPTMTADALLAGATWRCSRCGQLWDAIRLQTVAQYAIRERQAAADAQSRLERA